MSLREAITIEQEHEEILLGIDSYAQAIEWQTDFWRFNRECIGNSPETSPNLRWIDEPAMIAMCNWVGEKTLWWLANRHKLKKRMNVMILMPRKAGKSTTVTGTLPVFLNLHDPNISCCISSSKKDDAEKFLAVTKEHFRGWRNTSKLVSSFGEFYDPRRTWTSDKIVSAKRTDMARKDPTVWATGVEVGAGGTHPDVYIWDDPVLREKAGPAWYDACWKHYLDSFPVVGQDGLFILIMTRYGAGDPAGRIITEEIEPMVRAKHKGQLPPDFKTNWYKYAHLADWHVWFDQVYDDSGIQEEGREQFPSVWSHAAISEYRRTSEAEFAAQLMNMPGDRTDKPISQIHIDRAWVDLEDVPEDVWNKVTIHMDLAWKDYEAYIRDRGDYSVIQCWGHSANGNVYYLPIAWRGRERQEGFREQWVWVIQSLQRRRARPWCMTYDKPTGGTGDAIRNWFRDVANSEMIVLPPIHEITRGGKDSKKNRMLAAARYWVDGRVKLVRGAPYVQELVNEALEIGTSRFDDMFDAATDVFDGNVYLPLGRRSAVSGLGRNYFQSPEQKWAAMNAQASLSEMGMQEQGPETHYSGNDYFKDAMGYDS